MGRFAWFLAGMTAGAALMYGSLSYHFLYTKDGLKAVPKVSATLSDTFLDVREFDAADWAEHKAVAAAVIQADESEILEGAAVNSIREGVNRWIGELGGDDSSP